MDKKDLKPGAFYWVIPANDPDYEEHWESEPQPARYAGPLGMADGHIEHIWHCLGVEGGSDWPMKWIGEEIKVPHV